MSEVINYKQVCAHCGSTDALADAYAIWNVELQMWENVFDKGHYYCECDGECRIESEEL